MGHKRTLTESEEWERGLKDAVKEYKNGKCESLREATQVTGFHQSTIMK
jgi:hypothetical protein